MWLDGRIRSAGPSRRRNCAPYAEITPLASTTAFGRARAAKDSSREQYKRALNTFAWRIATVRWTRGDAIVVSFAASRNVSP